MKRWRGLWFDDELVSIEVVALPKKVLDAAREMNASEEDIWRASNQCVEAPDVKTSTGQRGHACYAAAETLDSALAAFRKRHPTKASS